MYLQEFQEASPLPDNPHFRLRQKGIALSFRVQCGPGSGLLDIMDMSMRLALYLGSAGPLFPLAALCTRGRFERDWTVPVPPSAVLGS